MKLQEFFETYQESLNQKVIQEFKPKYDFDPSRFLPAIKTLKRLPFPSQVHPIAGLASALTNGSRSGFLVGEMGVGKTLIALAIAYVGNFKKILILCPPHLVKKWKREIEETVPQASASIVDSITELERVVSSLNPKIHFVILSRERAKLGFRRKPAFTLRRRVEFPHFEYLSCVQCGRELVDQEGVPLSEDELVKRKLKCTAVVKGETLCGSPLWSADPLGPRRFPLADYIKKRYRKFFELLIID